MEPVTLSISSAAYGPWRWASFLIVSSEGCRSLGPVEGTRAAQPVHISVQNFSRHSQNLYLFKNQKALEFNSQLKTEFKITGTSLEVPWACLGFPCMRKECETLGKKLHANFLVYSLEKPPPHHKPMKLLERWRQRTGVQGLALGEPCVSSVGNC